MKHVVIDARIRRSSTGTYTDRLLEHLQSLHNTDLRFTVLIEPDDPWRSRAENFSVIPCTYPQFSFNPLNDLLFARQLRRLKPDLVHFTMTQQPLTYFGKSVTTTHDLTMLRFVRAGKTPAPIFWLKRLGYRFLFSAVHRKTNAVIVPTRFVEKDLVQHFPSADGKTYVTYESSEPPIHEAAEKLANVQQPFILHVGSPFPHKNIQRLIEAFELIQKTHPKLLLVLAGKKEFYFRELEAWAQQRPSIDAIRFPGFVSDSELKWLYEHAEAYVLPSLSEGFGLPGMEAMAHGCPLISSNATCLPEVYGDAAAYFDPHDTQAMAGAIDQVLQNKRLQKKYIAAGHKRLQRYSWHRMAEQTHEVYKKVLTS